MLVSQVTVKSDLNGHSKEDQKLVFKTDNHFWEHSAILLTCIKIPNGFQAFVLSNFEQPLKTGFTVYQIKLDGIVHLY